MPAFPNSHYQPCGPASPLDCLGPRPPHPPLPSEGLPGSTLEFLAYRIIYQAVHARHGEILQLLNTLKKVKLEVRPAFRLLRPMDGVARPASSV